MTESKGFYRAYGGGKRLTADREQAVLRAAQICDEYEAKGYTLTLRQLFYRHVTMGLLENTQREYDKLGGVVVDGRMAGLISWTSIEDRGRNLRGLTTWQAPQQLLQQASTSYVMDLWRTQLVRPEVWVEKDALVGVLEGICNNLRVDFFACRGYSSVSEMWRAGRRLANYVRAGQRPVVLYMGDHDPSGLHMTQDVASRLHTFAGTPVQVVRLALNRDQIDRLRLPPNPAKTTDSRFAAYAAEHGDESWELDALEPDYIQQLVRDAVDRMREEEAWQMALAQEVQDREWLVALSQTPHEEDDKP